MPKIGKLIVDNEKFDVFVCENCGEHEAQKDTVAGMLCMSCYDVFYEQTIIDDDCDEDDMMIKNKSESIFDEEIEE